MTPDELLKLAEANGLEVTVKGVNPDALGGGGKTTLFDEQMSEATFQEAVISEAQLRGWRVAHFRKVRVQRKDGTVFWETPVAADGKGFFDLELVRDRIIKAELKVPPNKPTPEQLAWAEAYTKAGVEWWIWTPKDWELILDRLK